jgi:hypothetical protein
MLIICILEMNLAKFYSFHDLFPYLFFQGEICVASSRVFVQEGIYDEIVKKLVEKAKDWTVGDPFDPKVRQGPQVITIGNIQKLVFKVCTRASFQEIIS